MGSADAARVAGNAEAKRAINVIIAAATRYTSGSVALTWNRNELTKRAIATEPTTIVAGTAA